MMFTTEEISTEYICLCVCFPFKRIIFIIDHICEVFTNLYCSISEAFLLSYYLFMGYTEQ